MVELPHFLKVTPSMLGKICAARDQLAIVPFAVYPVLAVIWMAIRRGTLREVQDTGRVP